MIFKATHVSEITVLIKLRNEITRINHLYPFVRWKCRKFKVWLFSVSADQRNCLCNSICAQLVLRYIQFGFFMLNLSIFSPFSLHLYVCYVFLVNISSAVSGLTVKETSKVGARPEKPIEIYEFERYFIALCQYFYKLT
jgi:hypothetical protein